MCGIAGVYGLDEIGDVQKVADSFEDSLKHRGPNASNSYIDNNVILSHTRLSILDLDERSNQPFTDSEKRFVLVFNGELYNFKDVKSKLSDYTFNTESDTEVLFAAWKKWGEKCVEHFNGMFAFSIWDSLKNELFIFRDRLGIKPLYFFQGDKNFVFASEVRTLLKSGLVPKMLDNNNLTEYLKYQTVHAPRTLVKDVRMVTAGSYLKISDSVVQEYSYWKPEDQVEKIITNKKEAKASIKRLLIESVEKRLISDVKVGAFLSGGIDSSLLVGIIKKELGKSIDTFSVTFNEEQFSEAKYSRIVAKKFETNHHEIELSSAHFKDNIPNTLFAMDHPSGDGPNSYVVSEAVKKEGITVALSGLGGDELFAGYPFFKRHLELQNKKYLLSFPPGVRSILGLVVKSMKSGIQGQKIAETLKLPYFNLEYTYPVSRRVLPHQYINNLLRTPQSVDVLSTEIQQFFKFNSPGSRLPELSKVSVVEISSYMQNVLLRDSDQMSMAHALEVRVPFLDHELVSHALSISDELKYPTFPKSLLVESFGDLLPEEIVHREKMGFILPWEEWLRNDLNDLCVKSLQFLADNNNFSEQGLFDLWKDFESKKNGINWSRVWPLVTLGIWMENNGIE